MEARKESNPEGGKRGVRLQALNAAMILIASVLSFLLLYATYKTTVSYGVMRDATETYIACQQDAASMQAASDYLTEQVRAFAVTGDAEDAWNYFQEAEETRRRDKALENMRSTLSETEAYQALSDALERSNELMEREYYSMRLTIEANGYSLSDFPDALRQIDLSAEDRALSAEAQRERAQSLVFDETYQQYKEGIRGDVDRCLETLIGETRTRQIQSSNELLELLRRQYVLIALLLVIVLVIVLLATFLIVRPLKRSVAHIQNNQPLPVSGSYELQYLARTYNRIFERTRQHQEELSYEATHDPLTGLYNRGVFEKIRTTCDQQTSALLLIDLDHLKEVNDTYGHEVGDLALKRAASILQSSFRSEDYVCRIGGDEFAVIMIHANSRLKDLVQQKIRNVNEALQNPEDGLPKLSLSVGVAFGDRENPTEDFYKDADAALYRVKNGGRNGCAFY